MLTVYTAMYGDYDKIIPVFQQDVECGFMFFTDSAQESQGWEKVDYHSEEFDKLSPSLKARYIKTHSHILIDGPSLWIDSNIMLNRPDALRWIADQYKGGVLAFKHPLRSNISEEMECLKSHRRFKHLSEKIDIQKQVYENDGYKFNNGLTMSGVLFRDNNEKIREFNELRWGQLITYCHRDQLSMHYCSRRVGISIQQPKINLYELADNGYIKIVPHIYDISIVINVYNNAEYTKQIIENIEETQDDINYELIIINDGSSDWTQARLNENWKGHRRLVEQENKGVTYCWNLGVSMASADYVAIINNDVLVERGCFRKLLDGFDDPDIMIVCPRYTQKKEMFGDRVWYYKHHIAGFFYVINKEAKERLFPIDSRLRIFGNDGWLYHKMIYMGKKVKFIKDVIIHHFLSKTVNPDPKLNVDKPIYLNIAKEEGWYIKPVQQLDDEPEGDLVFGL